jgi:ribonuclease Z
LFGLISTFRLLNREKELHIHGPKGLKEIVTLILKMSKSWTQYPLLFHEITETESILIFEDEQVEVYTIPLDHRIQTNGFLFREKPSLRKLDMKAISSYPEIEVCDYRNLQVGKDFTLSDGTVLSNASLTSDPKSPLSYAYCSDTAYNPALVPLITGVDCLYHETTFLDDSEELAATTKHSTAAQAASIAAQAKVGELIIGHYSSRYPKTDDFGKQAKAVFENTLMADTGRVFEIGD